jgi:hypothetical protein
LHKERSVKNASQYANAAAAWLYEAEGVRELRPNQFLDRMQVPLAGFEMNEMRDFCSDPHSLLDQRHAEAQLID